MSKPTGLVVATGFVPIGLSRVRASFVASGSVNNSSTSGTSVVIPTPSGAQSGDMLLAIVGYSGVNSITAPAGWTTALITSSASSRRIATFARAADGTEGASVTFTLGASVANIGVMLAYRNAGMIEASSGQENLTSTSAIAPTITTLSVSRVLVFGAVTGASGSFTAPSGMTERIDLTGTGLSLTVCDQLVMSPGSTGTRTATATVTLNNAAQLHALPPV